MKNSTVIIIALVSFLSVLGIGVCFGFKEEKTKEYYCPNGEMVDGKCKVVSTTSPTYYCKKKQDLIDGNKCRTVVFTIDAKKGEEQICKEGYSLYYMNGSNMCVSTETYEKIEKKTCPKASNKNEVIKEVNGKCVKTTCLKRDGEGNCLKSKEENVKYKTSMVCPSGTRYIYSACRYYSYRQPKYSCESGVLKGSKCYIYDDVDADMMCSEGYELDKDNKACVKTDFLEPEER